MSPRAGCTYVLETDRECGRPVVAIWRHRRTRRHLRLCSRHLTDKRKADAVKEGWEVDEQQRGRTASVRPILPRCVA